MRPLAADVFRSCPRADNVRISDRFLRYPDRNGYCLQLHADQHITDINTCMRLHMLYGDSVLQSIVCRHRKRSAAMQPRYRADRLVTVFFCRRTLQNNLTLQLITEQHVPAEQPINDAEEITANLLTANPDKDSVTAIFAAWDEPAIGAAKALAEAGRDKVIVTGVDGNEQAVQMIKDGSCLKATVKQNFEGMADIVCRQMEKYYAGETIEKGEMYAPAELITQENAQ